MKENRLSPTIAKLTLFQLEFYYPPQILSIQKVNVLAYSSVPAFFRFSFEGGVRAACFVLFDAGSHFVVNGKGIGVPTFSSKEGKRDLSPFHSTFP